MNNDKKLYKVLEKVRQIDDFGDAIEHEYHLGYTYAKTPSKAISNVKFAKKIKKRNHYEKDNYDANCLEIHDIYAIEVPDNKDIFNEYIIIKED